MHVHLQTPRLILRQFASADEDNLVNLNSDPEVMRYLTPQPPSRDAIRDEIIPFHLASYGRHPGFGTWAADDAVTGAFLGWFHLRPRISDGAKDLGYRLRRAAWNKGYATEGSRALIDKGFAEHGLDRIVAETLTVNLASRRVLEKCGLTLLRTFHPGDDPHPVAGAEQGHVEYELTRASWEPATQPAARRLLE